MSNTGHDILAELARREQELSITSNWRTIARPNQIAPDGEWRTWLILAGRGWGKTRTGAEHIHEVVRSGKAKRIALVARTAGDIRDVVVEGESGILATALPHERPHYEPSKRRLTWKNGAVATTFSADKPDQLRGPQFDYAWCDELAAWRYTEAWDMLMFGLRLGDDPRVVVTTTPKPTKIVRELAKQATTRLTTGTTYENRDNLAEAFFEKIVKKYEGTRLGRQELNAEILTDIPGALWTYDLIDRTRLAHNDVKLRDMVQMVVAIDPSASANEDSDETGIIVAGIDENEHGYVFNDLTLIATPDGWAQAAISAYHSYMADMIVAERNNGGDMVEHTLQTVDKTVPIQTVWASRGKRTRAEPVSALYEQGKIHHVGTFPELETQMCEWLPGEDSPDRMDALVWAFTELLVGGMAEIKIGRYA